MCWEGNQAKKEVWYPPCKTIKDFKVGLQDFQRNLFLWSYDVQVTTYTYVSFNPTNYSAVL